MASEGDRVHLTPADCGDEAVDAGAAGSSRCSKRGCALGSGIGLGVALVAIGISIAIAFPIVFHNLIAAMLPIANGSATYDTWASPTASTPVYMQFWLFNLTNGAEFLKGSKGAVQQVGPFTYQEHRNKWNITKYENSTISYKEYRSFSFRPDMSCCPEDTKLSMVNLAYFTVTSLLRHQSSIIQLAAEDLFLATKNPAIMTRTAKEILWGYKDPTLEFASDLAKFIKYKLNPMIGLFYGKNGTDDGEYLIFTGESDIGKLAVIDRWQGSMNLSTWDTAQANMINGSDGTMFPPFVDPAKPLYIYSTDICRSIYVTHIGPATVQGIDLLRFQAPAEVFQNATENPANLGFCLDGVCLDSGVLNLSTCQPGAPALSSQPHFYQGAQQYIDGVIGLEPGPDYATELDVEPNTGLVMKAAKKLQINLDVASGPGFHSSRDLVPVFMPLLWVNESATVDAETARQFRDTVLLAVRAAAGVQWASLAVGSACLAACAAVCVAAAASRRRRARRQGADDGSGYPEIGGSVQQEGGGNVA